MRRRPVDLIRSEGGAVAATYAIALMGLIAIGGVGFDYTRLVGMDTELQNGADQSALAGATQLDKTAGSCARAGNAAVEMLRNITLLASNGNQVTINSGNVITVEDDACDGFAPGDEDAPFTVRFFSTYIAQGDAGNVLATTDEDARYIEVRVDEETARYAFTPIGAMLRTLAARAVASTSGAICGTAAMFFCEPNLPSNFDPDTAPWRGRGLALGTRAGAGSWGYLQMPGSSSGNDVALVEQVLAQDEPTVECRLSDADQPILTGSATGLVRAINTRFDMFDNNIVTNNQPCKNLDDCSPASNVIKDLVKTDKDKWELPLIEFYPKSSPTLGLYHDSAKGSVVSMGMPRDLCHYNSFGTSCTSSTGMSEAIGDGNWPRADYFSKYHPTVSATDYGNMTRFETYKWELAEAESRLDPWNNKPGGTAKTTQHSRPVTVAASTSEFDRRVMTIAITRGTNGSCPAANAPDVRVDEWVDVFLVQPGERLRENYPPNFKENNSGVIYAEIIGRSKNAGKKQLAFRQQPYLIE